MSGCVGRLSLGARTGWCGAVASKGCRDPAWVTHERVCTVKTILYRVLYETAWHTYCTERRGRGSAKGGRGAQSAHPDQTGRHRVASRGTPRRLIFYEPRLVNRRTTRATPVWSSAGRRVLGRPPGARRSASRTPKKSARPCRGRSIRRGMPLRPTGRGGVCAPTGMRRCCYKNSLAVSFSVCGCGSPPAARAEGGASGGGGVGEGGR